MRKETIEAFKKAEIKVSLWNGYYNKAVVVVELVGKKYELTVEVTHPLLKDFGDNNRISLLCWKGGRGLFADIPAGLSELIREMSLKASMSDEQALAIRKNIQSNYVHTLEQMGILV